MSKLLAGIAGVMVVGLILAILLGWVVAAIWNHFPFMEAAHHMSWWDGVLLHLLGGLLFKSAAPSKS